MSENTPNPKLRIRYTDPDGNQTELLLSDKPITIGRSPDADIITLDERASRMHCGIRIWDGEYYIKDLKSKNGTFLNNQRVEMAKIKPGDRIRMGNSILIVDDKKAPGTDTTLSSVQDEMDGGKGYKTILREIVENTEGSASRHEPTKPNPEQADTQEHAPTDSSESTREPRTKTAKLVSPKDDASEDGDDASGTGSKVIRLNKSASGIRLKRK